jgi:hypothetical protein
VSEVGALVGDLLVLTGQCATGFGAVRATLFTSRQPARSALDLAFGFPEESRVFNHTPVGVGGETIKAHINAACRFNFNRKRLGSAAPRYHSAQSVYQRIFQQRE